MFVYEATTGFIDQSKSKSNMFNETNVCGVRLRDELKRRCTGIAEVMGSNPVEDT